MEAELKTEHVLEIFESYLREDSTFEVILSEKMGVLMVNDVSPEKDRRKLYVERAESVEDLVRSLLAGEIAMTWSRLLEEGYGEEAARQALCSAMEKRLSLLPACFRSELEDFLKDIGED